MEINKVLQHLLLPMGGFGYYAYKMINWLYYLPDNILSNKSKINKEFYKAFGRYPDLNHPKTLNEKIQWLKLYDHKPFYVECCDKFLMRNYILDKVGKECHDNLIPLIYETKCWKDITLDKLPNEPFIIKPTHTSGDYQIVRNKHEIDIKLLKGKCRYWLNRNYYKFSREWQYKNSPRRIIVEKLLLTSEGYIPNDYKFHYINGKLQFIYCSIARETKNYRKIYSPDWEPLPFLWVPKDKLGTQSDGDDIPAPTSLNQMKNFADIIAKDFDYVRVDFYDVDGKPYFGEITLHHGSGYDVFSPEEYDIFYGNKLVISDGK